HAYNTLRPHQSLNMATPASLFRGPATEPDLHSVADSSRSDQLGGSVPRIAPSADDVAPQPIEMEVRVPPSGVVVIAGLQQLWVGKNYAGLTVTLWIHLTRIHILLAEDVI